jgi:hypothetical protein
MDTSIISPSAPLIPALSAAEQQPSVVDTVSRVVREGFQNLNEASTAEDVENQGSNLLSFLKAAGKTALKVLCLAAAVTAVVAALGIFACIVSFTMSWPILGQLGLLAGAGACAIGLVKLSAYIDSPEGSIETGTPEVSPAPAQNPPAEQIATESPAEEVLENAVPMADSQQQIQEPETHEEEQAASPAQEEQAQGDATDALLS